MGAMARSSTSIEPLGPDSLTWRSFADPRSFLLTVRTALLQAMHPAISSRLVEKDGYFDNPWERMLQPFQSAVGVVYEGRRQNGIKDGSSLRPDVYYWAHATIFDSMLVGADLFGHPLTAHEQEQAYEESVLWYSNFGLSMRPVPPDLHSFRAYWFHMLDDVLEPTEAVLAALRPDAHLPEPEGRLKGAAWHLAKPFGIERLPMWLGVGLLPPEARDKLGLGWSPSQERLLQGVFAGLRLTWPLVPPTLRETAQARHGRMLSARTV